MSHFKAALIGLGKIAADYGSPDDAAPYCHAGGLLHAGRFDLLAAADLFEGAREKFREKWGGVFPQTRLESDIETMLSREKLDVVAVCVRGPYHWPVMRQVLAARPRLVFLEKPPTCSLAEMDELLALARANEVAVVVSYSRHWSPRVLEMERLAREGLIGRVHSVVGYCGGSVLSYASHTTDLICQLASAQNGPYAPQSVRARAAVPKNPDALLVAPEWAAKGYEGEPHLGRLHIEFGNGVEGVQIGGRGEGGEFYVDVFGDEGRARVGMYAEPGAWDRKGQPLDVSVALERSDTGPFTEAYGQIARFLDGGPLPDCAGENFVAVNEVGFGAIESLLSDGAKIELPNTRRDRKIYANG